MTAISPSYPDLLQNGTPADATQVMADFYQIQNDVNTNAAHNGANADITSLTGLTTPLDMPYGGTGATTAAAALAALGGAPLASPTFTGIPAVPTASPGTNTTQAASTAFVTAATAAITTEFSGAIKANGGTTVPAGYLECNGAAVSRTTYAALFTAIGTIWGVGDGSTTFNVPALARTTLVGRGGSGSGTLGNAVGNTGGEETHTLVITEMPNHNHNYTTGGSGGAGGGDYMLNSAATNNVAGGTAMGTRGGGGAHNNIQPSAVIMWVIKT